MNHLIVHEFYLIKETVVLFSLNLFIAVFQTNSGIDLYLK